MCQSMNMACNMYSLLSFSLQISLFIGHMYLKSSILLDCSYISASYIITLCLMCGLPAHILDPVFEVLNQFLSIPVSYLVITFGIYNDLTAHDFLIGRYWRVFLNYQKTENVLTAKASRYTGIIWVVSSLMRRNNTSVHIVGTKESN